MEPAAGSSPPGHQLAATLVQKALVREFRAKPGMPVWKRSEDGRSHALIITKLGRAAIKAEDDRERENVDVSIHGSASTDKAASAQSERRTPRQGSKLSTMIDLLGSVEIRMSDA